VNDAPVATDDAYTLDEDTPLNVPTAGVLGNDTDIDSPALTAVLVDAPQHGTLEFAADGGFLYTPNADYFGSDSFTYRANDGQLDSNLAWSPDHPAGERRPRRYRRRLHAGRRHAAQHFQRPACSATIRTSTARR
jgi:hypothetical protein